MPTGPPGRRAASTSPLTLFAGFAVLAAASVYAFQKLANQRGTPVVPGQPTKAKAYRQY